MDEEQEDEIQALKAIYDADFADIRKQPPCFMIKLTSTEVEFKSPVWLRFTFSKDYPSVPPEMEIPMNSQVLSPSQCQALLEHLQTQAQDLVGMAMVYSLVEAAQTWLSEHAQSGEGQPLEDEKQEPEEADVDDEPFKPVLDAKSSGGRWNFVIGLVGKPSAGKSTLFNAAVGGELAKTGAFPFTTIEPNIKQTVYSIPCPCQQWEKRCNSAYGHTSRGERLMPVTMKDVAGLVPGAYEGKGRGNRFLNDLLDADVLVHVVDASGQTDEKGEETEQHDPSKDVLWVEQELQHWIHQNVMEKWDSIKRRPQKLVDMFTGYHASKATISHVLASAGIGETELSALAKWNEDVLRRIVTHFVKIRFPILLALNKCDVPSSAEHIYRLSQLNQPCIPVSAHSERYLQMSHAKGEVEYHPGDPEFTAQQDLCSQEAQACLQKIRQSVFQIYGGTNVQQALTEAVELKQPIYGYPVSNLSTMKSAGSGSQVHREAATVLQHCIPLKPGTTVIQFFEILSNYPYKLLSGEFVRAELIDESGTERHVKKEEVLPGPYFIIKYMSTKRGAV